MGRLLHHRRICVGHARDKQASGSRRPAHGAKGGAPCRRHSPGPADDGKVRRSSSVRRPSANTIGDRGVDGAAPWSVHQRHEPRTGSRRVRRRRGRSTGIGVSVQNSRRRRLDRSQLEFIEALVPPWARFTQPASVARVERMPWLDRICTCRPEAVQANFDPTTGHRARRGMPSRSVAASPSGLHTPSVQPRQDIGTDRAQHPQDRGITSALRLTSSRSCADGLATRARVGPAPAPARSAASAWAARPSCGSPLRGYRPGLVASQKSLAGAGGVTAGIQIVQLERRDRSARAPPAAPSASEHHLLERLHRHP